MKDPLIIKDHLKALEVPYSSNKYFERDFFAPSYSKVALISDRCAT